jgi:hypothetical protein
MSPAPLMAGQIAHNRSELIGENISIPCEMSERLTRSQESARLLGCVFLLSS